LRENLKPSSFGTRSPRARHHSGKHQPSGTRAGRNRPDFLVKINANIGNSVVTSSIEEEVEKMTWAIRWGADTVMDLSTGKTFTKLGNGSSEIPRSDRDSADLPGFGKGRREGGRAIVGGFSRHPYRAGGTGVDYFTIHAGVLLRYIPLTAKRLAALLAAAVPSCQVVPCTSRGELSLHQVRRDLRNHEVL